MGDSSQHDEAPTNETSEPRATGEPPASVHGAIPVLVASGGVLPRNAAPGLVMTLQRTAGNRAAQRVLARWDSPEHVALGDTAAGSAGPRIVLRAHDRDIPNRTSAPSAWGGGWARRHAAGNTHQKAALEHGLTYGEVVALVGDFYENWDRLDNAPLTEVFDLIPLIRGHASTSQLQQATAGRYLALASVNISHFSNVPAGQRNVDVWRRMHVQAINAALSGNRNRAWGLNGAADHFLTDGFSGGHIRTPRGALVGSALGNIESKILHDLDNEYGVEVTNARGDRAWIAYGDEHFTDAGNATNRRVAEEAVRLSRRDISDAIGGRMSAPTSTTAFEAERLVPRPVSPGVDRWTGRTPTYIRGPRGIPIRLPDDYTRVRNRVIAHEGPGVVAGLFNDDDQVRAWVRRNTRRTIGFLTADEKIRMIETLIGGVFSVVTDDDMEAIEKILSSVTSESEMVALRTRLSPRATDLTDHGDRARFRLALARRP